MSEEVTYEQFKQTMLDYVEDYQAAIDQFKEYYGDGLQISDVTNTFSIIAVLYSDTMLVADDLGLDKERQHEFLAQFLDDIFVFQNEFVERYDKDAFKILLRGVESLFDSLSNLMPEETVADTLIDNFKADVNKLQ